MNIFDSILSAYGEIYVGLLSIALFFLLSLIIIHFSGGGKDE